jgi:hypothetical protein
MELILGFDPGGNASGARFGWAVAENSEEVPVRVVATGTSAHAEGAVSAAFGCVAGDDRVVAVGVDSPMYWTPTGERKADLKLREILRERGAGSSAGGTVQHLNSLQGACLVQGPIAASLVRRRFPDIALTESHPKALLWALRIASKDLKPASISATQLSGLLRGPIGESEDERDAVLGAFVAWGMVTRQSGWSDLVAIEDDPIFLACGKAEYWFPTAG